MKVIDRNEYGTLQQVGSGYRIIRGGDWLVSYRGPLKTIGPLFKRLGKRVKTEKHSKRLGIDNGETNWRGDEGPTQQGTENG